MRFLLFMYQHVEAYKDIDPEKIKQLEAVDLDIDVLTKDCEDAQ